MCLLNIDSHSHWCQMHWVIWVGSCSKLLIVHHFTHLTDSKIPLLSHSRSAFELKQSFPCLHSKYLSTTHNQMRTGVGYYFEPATGNVHYYVNYNEWTFFVEVDTFLIRAILVLCCHTSKISSLSRLPWGSGEFCIAETVWMALLAPSGKILIEFQEPSPHTPVEVMLCVIGITVFRPGSCWLCYLWPTACNLYVLNRSWDKHFFHCLHSSTWLLVALCFPQKYCEDCPLFCFCKDPNNGGSGRTYSSK
jgi:hypothetical protein